MFLVAIFLLYGIKLSEKSNVTLVHFHFLFGVSYGSVWCCLRFCLVVPMVLFGVAYGFVR